VRFLICLNTSNIEIKEVSAPRLKNKMLARKNKFPLFGYHYIDLPDDVSSEEALGGTHASPRRHWRRGHIRRCKNKIVWIKPQLVGKNGFIDKEYRANY